MPNKDIKLNIKLDTPASSQDYSLLNKVFIAIGLSLSTTVTDSLNMSNPFTVIGLIAVIVMIAIFTHKKV
ncbi:MAG: hypothetical protein ACKKL6_03840 [Candidatus Komeilibacteria bacterium]